jgi:hypothetical protein
MKGVVFGRVQMSPVGLDNVELVDPLLLIVGGGVVGRDVLRSSAGLGSAGPGYPTPLVVAILEDTLNGNLEEVRAEFFTVLESFQIGPIL